MKKNMMFLTLMLALVLIVSACGTAAPATPEATGNGSSTATTESKTISVKHALDENPVQVKVNPKMSLSLILAHWIRWISWA